MVQRPLAVRTCSYTVWAGGFRVSFKFFDPRPPRGRWRKCLQDPEALRIPAQQPRDTRVQPRAVTGEQRGLAGDGARAVLKLSPPLVCPASADRAREALEPRSRAPDPDRDTQNLASCFAAHPSRDAQEGRGRLAQKRRKGKFSAR